MLTHVRRARALLTGALGVTAAGFAIPLTVVAGADTSTTTMATPSTTVVETSPTMATPSTTVAETTETSVTTEAEPPATTMAPTPMPPSTVGATTTVALTEAGTTEAPTTTTVSAATAAVDSTVPPAVPETIETTETTETSTTPSTVDETTEPMLSATADEAADADIRPAEVIDGAITSVGVREESARPWQAVTLDVTWAVPDSARSGDTFTLTLPPELQAVTRGFELRAPDGALVAVASIDGGVVTFTLTDYVDTRVNVRGTAFFSARFTDAVAGETEHLVFETSGPTFTDSVDILGSPGIDRTTSFKSGRWVDVVDQGVEHPQGALRWEVQTPAGPFSQARFVDSPRSGHEIDCDSIAALSYTRINDAGFAYDPAPLGGGRYDIVSCTPTSLQVTAGPAGEGEILAVRYTTSVVDGATSDDYRNRAVVTVDGVPSTRVAVVERTDDGGDGEGDLVPAVDIEKWSTVDGLVDGDYDTLPGKELRADARESITMTITNTGTDALVDVEVRDTTDVGPALTELDCAFPDGSTGTTWAGPFAPGASFECSGVLPALGGDSEHSDTASVVAVGETSATTVTDDDTWHGYTPSDVTTTTSPDDPAPTTTAVPPTTSPEELTPTTVPSTSGDSTTTTSPTDPTPTTAPDDMATTTVPDTTPTTSPDDSMPPTTVDDASPTTDNGSTTPDVTPSGGGEQPPSSMPGGLPVTGAPLMAMVAIAAAAIAVGAVMLITRRATAGDH